MLAKAQLCYKVFKQADLFGQNILLNINGEDNYRTGAGGLFSVMIVVIVAVFFQSNIISFLSKTNITADVQTVFQEDPDRIYLNDKTFMFALAIDQDEFNTNPYFNISVEARTYLHKEDGSLKKIKKLLNLIPCTLDRFQNIFQSNNQDFTRQFSYLGLDQWLCPDYGYELLVGGRYTSDIFDFVKIDVTACSNDTVNNEYLTWKPTCASQEELNDHLSSENSFRIRLYTTNSIVNAGQPKDYMQIFLDDDLFFEFVPTKLVRSSDIYFTKNSLDTDNSLVPVFGDVKHQDIIVRTDYRDIVILGTEEDTTFTQLYLRRSPFTTETFRNFQKIDDLLSYLGGFANIVVVFLGFFVGFYNKQQYLIELANKVYNFDFTYDPQKSQQIRRNAELARRITHIRKKTTKLSILHEVKDSGDHKSKTIPNEANSGPKHIAHETHGPTQDIKLDDTKSDFQQQQEKVIKKLGLKSRKDYLITQIQLILNRGEPIIFNIRFLLNQMTCGKFFNDKRVQLLDRAINRINEDLDIYLIIEKLKEVRLLKELVLNKDQQILFNFAPKELITLSEMKVLPSRLDFTRVQSEESSFNTFGNIAEIAMKSTKKIKTNPQLRAYYKVYKAYDRLFTPDEKPTRVNQILTQRLGQEIKDIFEVSQFISFDGRRGVISNRLVNILRKKVVQVRQRLKEREQGFGDESDIVDMFSMERNQMDDKCNILHRELNFKGHV